jgi:hypothetical protein
VTEGWTVIYQVVVTFDLVDASSEQYRCVRDELSSMGLYSLVIGSNDQTIDLPYNTFQGDFYGSSSGELRDSIRSRMVEAFRRCGVAGPIFVTVGGVDWTWGTTRV